MQEKNGENVWFLHSRMEDLVHSVNTDDAYEQMLVATKRTLEIVPDGYRVIVAETINGRKKHKYREGLIFRSYDRGRCDHAAEYVALSLSLAESDWKNMIFPLENRTSARVGNAIKDCKLIKRKLRL